MAFDFGNDLTAEPIEDLLIELNSDTIQGKGYEKVYIWMEMILRRITLDGK